MKQILSAPGYFVTADGRVFSTIKFGRWQDECRELAQSLNRSGYQTVRIYQNGKRIKRPVHRLVAEAFILKPTGAVMVRHLDDNKTNNTISNLAWGTALDNAADAMRNGRTLKGRPIKRSHYGEDNPNAKLTHEQTLEIRRKWESRVTLASLGREYGVEYPTIAAIVKGKRWSTLVRKSSQTHAFDLSSALDTKSDLGTKSDDVTKRKGK